MKKSTSVAISLFLASILIVIGGVYAYDKYIETIQVNNDGSKEDIIRVNEPAKNGLIKSPVIIKGEARGTWFFEASFVVKLQDANGTQIGLSVAQAKSDWMTEDFVPFEAEISYSAPATKSGVLIFEKANPSDLQENANELRIPVEFDLSLEPQAVERTVLLYYYDPSKDQYQNSPYDNVMCTEKGLVPVQRQELLTRTPIQDTIKLLIQGDLTEQEKAQGITTEYPLAGFELKEASLNSGVLTLAFDDPDNKTSGGSCRTGILWYQIEATAKQFAEVESVKFIPEELFQP